MSKQNKIPRTLPLTADQLEQAAQRAVYKGSLEHKQCATSLGPAAWRSDATPCPNSHSGNLAANSQFVAEAIRRGCISPSTEDGLPRYVWGWVGDKLYEARLLAPAADAAYKGYPVGTAASRSSGQHPVPQDDAGRLQTWRRELDTPEADDDPV